MKASAKITVTRSDIVPTTDRAQWLETHGVPEDTYELVVAAPITLWAAAGVQVEPSGTLTFGWYAGNEAKKMLAERACVNARKSMPPTLSEDEVVKILEGEASRLSAARDQKAADAAKAHELLLRWLDATDSDVIGEHGVYVYWDGAVWGAKGEKISTVDASYSEAYDRRIALFQAARREKQRQQTELEATQKSLVQAWAAEQSVHVRLGLKLGYPMGEAIAQLIAELVASQFRSSDRDVDVIVQGSRQWEIMAYTEETSPEFAALGLVQEYTLAIKTLRAEGLPECVTFDESEALICSPSQDASCDESFEPFCAVVVTCEAPGLRTFNLYTRV